MAAFADLLGPSLVATSSGKVKRFDTVKTAEALANTCVGLVFAADWSEESRVFVARLVEAHAAVVAAGNAFQPVLVSSDRNVDAFAKLLGASRPPGAAGCSCSHSILAASAPGWLAVPYTDALAAKESALCAQFQVKAPPALVMLAPDASVLNRSAKSRIHDPAAFPWPPPSIAEALGPRLTNEYGDSVSTSSVTGRRQYVALFFGAVASCGRSRGFSQRLKEVYALCCAEGAPLEVVYVSRDNTAAEAAREGAAMPWLCLPWEERWRAEALADFFEVTSLPALVLLDPGLGVANRDARAAAERGAPFPWLPRLVWDADSRDDWTRNPAECPVLIVLAERAGGSWDALEAAMGTVAAEAAAAPAPARRPGGLPPQRPVFLLARERGGVGAHVRRLALLGEAGPRPQAVLLDLAASGSFYAFDGGKELSAANLRAFLAAYSGGTLLPLQGAPMPTLTVLSALSHVPPGSLEEINPWEAALQCILCPVTCPLLCAFNCCLGCCMLGALGAAMGASHGAGAPTAR